MAEKLPVHGVGVIGLGAIGRVVLGHMARHPRFDVVAAWDPDAAARDAVRADRGGFEIAGDAGAVIANPDVGVLYIASPPLAHAEYVRAAAEAGKAVLCEKPLGIDLGESRSLLDLVRRAGVPSAVNFNHNNALASTRLESLLASGAMGEPAGIDIFIHLEKWPREFQAHAAWLAGREQGGFTREMVSHWFYLSRRLFGEGRLLMRSVRYPDDPRHCETRVLAELEFGGIPAIVNAAVAGAGPVGTEYTVWGSQQSCRIHAGRLSTSDGGAWSDALGEVGDIAEIDHVRNLDAAAARFDGGDVKMADLADGYAVQMLVETLLDPAVARK